MPRVGAVDIDTIRADVGALAAMTRGSAAGGERAAAAWAAERLRAAAVADVRIEPYHARTTNSWSFAAHAAAGLAAARAGGGRGAALALAALASLERDVSGRAPWRRRILGGGTGANLVARIPGCGPARRTVVLVAHLDAARTGLAWHPRVNAFGAARRLRTRKADPVMGLQAVGLLAAAAGALGGRRRAARPVAIAGAVLNAAGVALNLDIARSPVVPGANDNATGVAVALELARRLSAAPLDHVDVVVALVGCEETGMGGFHAFLTARRHELEPATTFVLGLDTLGCGTPILAAAEGTMRTYAYAEADLALVEAGALRAGEPLPARWRIGAWTDPLLALTRGIPAASLLSIGPGYYPHYHHPSDLPEHVDWGSVGACARIAAGTLAELDRRCG